MALWPNSLGRGMLSPRETSMRQADIAVYDRDHDIQLVAEVQGRTGASPEWVREIRRNLLTAKAIPLAPYFLLAMPDAL